MVVDAQTRDFLEQFLPQKLIREAEEITQKLCPTGQILAALFLVQAHQAGKFRDAISLLHEAWAEFRLQDQSVRGNPDLGGNAERFARIFARVGLSAPLARM